MKGLSPATLATGVLLARISPGHLNRLRWDMNKLKCASLLLAGGLAITLPGLLPAQDPGQSPRSQEQSQAPDNQSTMNTFAGKVTKGQNGSLVLEDVTKSSSYSLDNQKLAKKFEGKAVVVTGTLDASNNIIHVKKIELAA